MMSIWVLLHMEFPFIPSASSRSFYWQQPALIGAVAASFFLPQGYLGMSLLGIRHAPWIATITVALSLVGWIPWAALMGLDSLAYDIGRTGSTPQLDALWTNFNGDAVMTTYLLTYKDLAQFKE